MLLSELTIDDCASVGIDVSCLKSREAWWSPGEPFYISIEYSKYRILHKRSLPILGTPVPRR